LAVVFGVRLPRALTVAFVLKASEGIAGLSVAMLGLIAARTAVMTTGAAIETYDKSLGGLPSVDDHPRRRPTDRAHLCGCD
jgi:transposase